MDRYDERIDSLFRALGQRGDVIHVAPETKAMFSGALREAAAEAYEDAANTVKENSECVDEAPGCPECDHVFNLRDKAAALRSEKRGKEKK